MSEIRLNFIDWRPDLEDEAHDGLTVADNVIHEPEGYKPIRLETALAFTTNTALGTVLSVQVRPSGVSNDRVAAWVRQIDASTAALSVGTYDAGAFSGSATSTLTGVTSTGGSLVCRVISFQTAELADYLVLTAVAEGATSPTTTALAYITGRVPL